MLFYEIVKDLNFMQTAKLNWYSFNCIFYGHSMTRLTQEDPLKRCVQHKEIETYNQCLVRIQSGPFNLEFFSMLLAKSLNVFEDKEEGVGP